MLCLTFNISLVTNQLFIISVIFRHFCILIYTSHKIQILIKYSFAFERFPMKHHITGILSLHYKHGQWNSPFLSTIGSILEKFNLLCNVGGGGQHCVTVLSIIAKCNTIPFLRRFFVKILSMLIYNPYKKYSSNMVLLPGILCKVLSLLLLSIDSYWLEIDLNTYLHFKWNALIHFYLHSYRVLKTCKLCKLVWLNVSLNTEP